MWVQGNFQNEGTSNKPEWHKSARIGEREWARAYRTKFKENVPGTSGGPMIKILSSPMQGVCVFDPWLGTNILHSTWPKNIYIYIYIGNALNSEIMTNTILLQCFRGQT